MIDSDHRTIRDHARERAGQSRDPVERAVKLYLSVRDEIRYDPYTPFYLPDHVEFHGIDAAIPVNEIVEAWEKAYGKERAKNWIKGFEKSGGKALSRFEREDILKA